MKTGTQYWFLAVVAILVIAGCKQKFDVTSPTYKEIPVVYGLLNHQESPNFIRIQKGYLLKGNAYTAAGVLDSIYYPDILKVELKSATGSSLPVSRIFVHGKDSGTFSSPDAYLYQVGGTLDPAQTYTLTVTNTESGKTFSANTSLVNDYQILSPAVASKLDLSNSTPYKVKWAAAKNAGIYDLTISLYYYEDAAGVSTYKSIDIPMFRSLQSSGNNTEIYDFSENNLMNFLQGHMPNNDTLQVKVTRTFHKMMFNFAAGGNELTKFLTSQNAQSGLASSNSLPIYTNISGGVGLLSSRAYESVDSVLLTPAGLDSLACGSGAHGLGFKNFNGNTCN